MGDVRIKCCGAVILLNDDHNANIEGIIHEAFAAMSGRGAAEEIRLNNRELLGAPAPSPAVAAMLPP
jgi:hypothetical protein